MGNKQSVEAPANNQTQVGEVAATMKAVAFSTFGDASVFEDVTIDTPKVQGRDVLVRVLAAAVNPIDTKVRANGGNATPVEGGPKVVGWDAAGVVVGTGPDATLYKVGDEVMFAGSITRAGSYAEFTAVDERIVGRKPASLSWDDAATVPLVALTAWEALEEGLGLSVKDKKGNAGRTLLIVNGGGGVGSLAVQLAKRVFGVGKVVATASRDETIEFSKANGADHVINHREDLAPQLKELGIDDVPLVLSLVDINVVWDKVIPVVRPFGHVVYITASGPVNLYPDAMFKRVTLTGEFMFGRAMYDLEQEKQKAILDQVATHVDAKRVTTPLRKTFPLTATGVREAHVLQESGKMCGKIALVREKFEEVKVAESAPADKTEENQA